MAFRIKKYRDISMRDGIPKISMGVGGEFKYVLRDANGRFLYETDWKKNIITNYGLSNMSDWSTNSGYMYIGDSAAAPAFTDTALFGLLAGPVSFSGTTNVISAGIPDYEWYSIRSAHFGVGVGTGTIQEVGIGASGSQVSNTLFIRSAVNPGIVKNADQILDVYYRFYIYPGLIDTTGTVTIDAQDYNWTSRFGRLDGAYSAFNGLYFWQGTSITAYDGTFGAIDGFPSGSAQSGSFPTNAINAAYSIDGFGIFTIDQANTVGAAGIKAITIRLPYGVSTNTVRVQTAFSRVSDGAGIFKDDTQQLDMSWRLSWSRH